MEALTAYTIPVSSLRNGRNELDFSVDWRFFRHFEGSPVEQGSFKIGVVFEKFPDHWHLWFDVSGVMDTECDRCLVPISLPVSGEYGLYVKFDPNATPDPSGDVIYVAKETTQLHIAQYLYEFIVLSIPVAKRINCEGGETAPCDMEMLARLDEEVTQDPEGTPWDVLKEIQITK